MDILTRKYAKEYDLPKYFTGKPCKKGHVAPRYTVSGGCQACINGYESVLDTPEIIERSPALEAALATQNHRRESMISAKLASEKEAQERLIRKGNHRNMHKIIVVIYDFRWLELRDKIIKLVQQRYPLLTDEDIAEDDCRVDSFGNTHGAYRLKANLADHEAIHALAAAINKEETAARLAAEIEGVEGIVTAAHIVSTGHDDEREQYRRYGQFWYLTEDVEKASTNQLTHVKPAFPASRYIPVKFDRAFIEAQLEWNGKKALAKAVMDRPAGSQYAFIHIYGEWFREDTLRDTLRNRRDYVMSMDPTDGSNYGNN